MAANSLPARRTASITLTLSTNSAQFNIDTRRMLVITLRTVTLVAL